MTSKACETEASSFFNSRPGLSIRKLSSFDSWGPKKRLPFAFVRRTWNVKFKAAHHKGHNAILVNGGFSNETATSEETCSKKPRNVSHWELSPKYQNENDIFDLQSREQGQHKWFKGDSRELATLAILWCNWAFGCHLSFIIIDFSLF